MCTHPDLPAAVDYEDQRSLRRVEEAALNRMLAECARWCSWMAEIKSGLDSGPGRTLWNVLVRQDCLLVIDAQRRIRREVEARRRRPGRHASAAGPAEDDAVVATRRERRSSAA